MTPGTTTAWRSTTSRWWRTAARATTRPAVTGTTPADNATNVPVASTIAITFSESVTATASAFSIQCPAGRAAELQPVRVTGELVHAHAGFPAAVEHHLHRDGNGEPGHRCGRERSAESDGGRLHVLLHDRIASVRRSRRTSSSMKSIGYAGHRRRGVHRALRRRRGQHVAHRPGARVLQRQQ